MNRLLIPGVLALIGSLALWGCQRGTTGKESGILSPLSLQVVRVQYLEQADGTLLPVSTPVPRARVLVYAPPLEVSGSTDEQGFIQFPTVYPAKTPVTVAVETREQGIFGALGVTFPELTLLYPLPETLWVQKDPALETTRAGIVQGIVTAWTLYTPPGTSNRAHFFARNLSGTTLLAQEGKREAVLSADPPPTVRQCLAPLVLEAENFPFGAGVSRDPTLGGDSGDSLQFSPGSAVTSPDFSAQLTQGAGTYSVVVYLMVSRNDLSQDFARIRVVSSGAPLTQGVNSDPAVLTLQPSRFVTSSTFIPFELSFSWDGTSPVALELERLSSPTEPVLWWDRSEVVLFQQCTISEDPYLGPRGVRFPVPEGFLELAMVEHSWNRDTGRYEEVLSLWYDAEITVSNGEVRTLSFFPEIRPAPQLCTGNPENQMAIHFQGLPRRFYTPEALSRLSFSLLLRSPLGLTLELFPEQEYTFKDLEQGGSLTDQVLYLRYPFALSGELSGFSYGYNLTMRYNQEEQGIPVTVTIVQRVPGGALNPCTLEIPLNLPSFTPLAVSFPAQGGIEVAWEHPSELLRLVLSGKASKVELLLLSPDLSGITLPSSWLPSLRGDPLLLHLYSYLLSTPIPPSSEILLQSLPRLQTAPFVQKTLTLPPLP